MHMLTEKLAKEGNLYSHHCPNHIIGTHAGRAEPEVKNACRKLTAASQLQIN